MPAFESPAHRDAGVLDLLRQAEQLGYLDEIRLRPDGLGPLDPALWKSRNGYDERDLGLLCAGVRRNGDLCGYRRAAGSQFCGVHGKRRTK